MKNKQLFKVLYLPILITAIVGCHPSNSSGAEDYAEVSGTYNLLEAHRNDDDITQEFTLYRIILLEDKTSNVFISNLGLITNRPGTYRLDNDHVIESSSGEQFVYLYSKVAKTLTYTYDDFGDEVIIVLKRDPKPEEIDHTVDFSSVLFGEGIDETKKFNYAPTVIIDRDEEEREIMHIWYCTNKDTTVIMDHIGYRKGVKLENGRWEFSEEKIVLTPTINTWDARHNCDPSVVKGEFHWGEETYSYLMAYLGCTTDDYSNNETGIAVSKNPEGPWIKVDHLNPIVPWARNNASGRWGTGMPSLLSIDGKGLVFLFYIDSAIVAGVEKWDLFNLNNAQKLMQAPLMSKGFAKPNNIPTTIGYIDVAYDENKDRFYLLSGTHYQNPVDGTRSLVNSHAALLYLDNITSMTELENVLMSQDYTWKLVDYVGPDETGHVRNHNPAIVTNPFGYIIDSSQIPIVVSTGRNDYPFDNIFTYRLCGYIFKNIPN